MTDHTAPLWESRVIRVVPPGFWLDARGQCNAVDLQSRDRQGFRCCLPGVYSRISK